MGKLNVKNGTPMGEENLCRNCSNGQFTIGDRASDVFVICTNSSPARIVPFPVYECTEFWDRNRLDYKEMTDLALNFNQCRRKPTPGFRGAGFMLVPAVFEDEDGDDNDSD